MAKSSMLLYALLFCLNFSLCAMDNNNNNNDEELNPTRDGGDAPLIEDFSNLPELIQAQNIAGMKLFHVYAEVARRLAQLEQRVDQQNRDIGERLTATIETAARSIAEVQRSIDTSNAFQQRQQAELTQKLQDTISQLQQLQQETTTLRSRNTVLEQDLANRRAAEQAYAQSVAQITAANHAQQSRQAW